ncbi:8019_t:CDS:1, partial [Gigaspora margarita]
QTPTQNEDTGKRDNCKAKYQPKMKTPAKETIVEPNTDPK